MLRSHCAIGVDATPHVCLSRAELLRAMNGKQEGQIMAGGMQAKGKAEGGVIRVLGVHRLR